MALFAAPASAAKKRFDRGHHHRHVAKIESSVRHVDHGPTALVPVPGGFVVPTVIRSGRLEIPRPFYRGRSRVYEPHQHCGTRLVAGAVIAHDAPRVSFRIAF